MRNEDEDLVSAIALDKSFFQNKEMQKALVAVLRNPGSNLNTEQEVILESFDTVLPHRHNRERVNKAVTVFLRYLAEEVWNLAELRPIYELQFQRITAESLQEQVTLHKAHLQANLSLNRDIRDALLQLAENIAEQKALLSEKDEQLLSLPVLHNLPQPDYERFVGREREIQHLQKILSPKSRHFVVTVDGIGGIGKSTLALEVAERYRRQFYELPKEDRFAAIIWITAKQTVLTGEGILNRPQPHRTLDDIYTTISVTLHREDISRAPADEQDDLICQALTHQRTLLIIDNLETVDDERVLTFIREVPDPTKVIVTTRHRLNIAYPIRLVAMIEDDSLQLIEDTSKFKGVDLTENDMHQLYKRTGGVPLALVWSVAQMGAGYTVETVLNRLGEPTDDVAKFCFENAIDCICNRSAYKLLLALSLFATDATREALGFVADLPTLDRDNGLVELEKLSLINKQADRFQMLPLTLTYTSTKLAKNTDLSDQLRIRWIQYWV